MHVLVAVILCAVTDKCATVSSASSEKKIFHNTTQSLALLFVFLLQEEEEEKKKIHQTPTHAHTILTEKAGVYLCLRSVVCLSSVVHGVNLLVTYSQYKSVYGCLYV